MGLFGKKKPSQEDASRASNIFAERDKQPQATEGGGGVEDRIFGYTSHKGADEVKAQSVAHLPTDRISELRRIRESRVDTTAAEEAKKIDEEGRSAADVYMTARKNIIDSTGIQKSEQPSAEDRAEIERRGMNTLDNIVSGIKNKQFLTEVDEEVGEILEQKRAAKSETQAADNLAADEVAAATAKFRNVGFFTETEVDETKKVLTADEKLEKDLDELEFAEKAIASFTNVGFQNRNLGASPTAGEEVSEEIKEQVEGEGN